MQLHILPYRCSAQDKQSYTQHVTYQKLRPLDLDSYVEEITLGFRFLCGGNYTRAWNRLVLN
jgi:hypothetical protein